MRHRLEAKRRDQRIVWRVGLAGCVTVSALILAYYLPPVHNALFWRIAILKAEIRQWAHPHAATLQTPIAAKVDAGSDASTSTLPGGFDRSATPAPAVSVLPAPTASNQPAPAGRPRATPLPATAALTGVPHEYQGWNNCGPATLSMNLRYWGWDGDQSDAAIWLKPDPEDKNVRPDEMEAYVAAMVPGFGASYRVGGNLELLRTLIASGYPVIVAKGLWAGDNKGWMGHYLLLSAYDDAAQEFTTQDALDGPNRRVGFGSLDADWQAFNRAFIVVYPGDRAGFVSAVLGDYADPALSHRIALEAARAETQSDPQNAFAWNNLGANLNYFGDFESAAEAYDEARRIGLPWRMLWYQTGLYSAYYRVGRYREVLVLANMTLENAGGNLEESLYWRGWAKNALGDVRGAERDFKKALVFNANFQDARQALALLASRTPAVAPTP